MLRGEDKELLLIAPKYFGYENEIKNRLESYGFKVSLIYENLDKVSHYYKFIKSRFPQKMGEITDRFFIDTIRKCSKETKVVVVIRGEYLSPKDIALMKEYFAPECKYVLYQWDGVKNNPNSLVIADKFDRVFSFDISDSNAYGWRYRPLFYIDKYINRQTKSIDLLYVCSLHSDRVRILNEIKNISKANGLTYKAVLYEKRYIYLKRKYIDRKKDYIFADDSDMTFRPLSIQETYELYGKARAVVDYTHPGQTGLTMRTIECIGNACKLITNNTLIKSSNFFNENNILIYQDALNIPIEFIKSDYIVNAEIIKKYSIDSFLEDLLGDI